MRSLKALDDSLIEDAVSRSHFSYPRLRGTVNGIAVKSGPSYLYSSCVRGRLSR